MLKIKIIVSVASLVASLTGLYCLGQLSEQHGDSAGPVESHRDSKENCCDYFNGKVVETSEGSIWLEPIEGWEYGDVDWSKVSRVEFAKIDDFTGRTIPTLPKDLENGDEIRVAYNGDSLEWRGDEVFIGIVFGVYLHPLE